MRFIVVLMDIGLCSPHNGAEHLLVATDHEIGDNALGQGATNLGHSVIKQQAARLTIDRFKLEDYPGPLVHWCVDGIFKLVHWDVRSSSGDQVRSDFCRSVWDELPRVLPCTVVGGGSQSVVVPDVQQPVAIAQWPRQIQ